MKTICKYIFLCLPVLLNIFLGIYIAQKLLVGKREYVDEMNRESEYYAEEMARQLAEVYIEELLSGQGMR